MKSILNLKNYIKDGSIAYVMDNGNYLGGAGNHLLRHAMLSKEYNLNMLVIIPEDSKGNNGIVEKICVENKLPYCFCNYCVASEFDYINGDMIVKSINRFSKVCSKFNIKFFHSVQLNPAVEIVSRKLGIPHVMSIYQISKNSFQIGYPDIFPKYIHSDSELYAEMWAKGLNAKSKCIRSYIPEKFKKNAEKGIINENKCSFNFIVSGTLCERKSQHKIIEVIGRLKEKGIIIELDILGYYDIDKAYYEKCKTTIDNYNLEEQIVFEGFCDNVVEKMKGKDALICVSKDESFPQAILEAMAMKIPVISTPVAGVPELIIDEKTGYLSEDFSEEAIYKTIEKFIYNYNNNKSNIESIIKRAYEIYEKESSKEIVADKLYMFYCNAVDNSKYYSVNLEEKEFINKMKNYYELDFSQLSNELNDIQYKLVQKLKFQICYKINYLQGNYEREKKTCYIWGASNAGKATEAIVKRYLNNFEINGYIDKFKIGNYGQHKIYKPTEVEIYNSYIFIATYPGKFEAYEYLKSKCLIENTDFMFFCI